MHSSLGPMGRGRATHSVPGCWPLVYSRTRTGPVSYTHLNEQLHNPPWANEWIVEQAKAHRIDAALVLEPLGTRPSATGNLFIERALEAAGVPVLPIAADMVDARGWNGLEMRQKVGHFLERI